MQLREFEVDILNNFFSEHVGEWNLTKKRITFTLDEDLDKKIRHLQVELITKTNHGWSYSSVLSVIIEEGLKVLSTKKLTKK